MALRILLISAVASLGLTLPEEREVRTWAAEAQTWVNARLVEWDARCAGEGGGELLLSRPHMSVSKGMARGDAVFDAAMDDIVLSFSTERPTAPAREERVATLAAPTVEPMVIGEDLYTGMAYALNRASEGSDLARLAIGEREAPAEFPSMAVAKVSPSDVTRSLSRREGEPVQGLAEKASGRREGDFEPMVVGDDLYAGVAYALNRASEGIVLTAEDSTSQASADCGSETSAASRVSQLSVALRLTREAVYAWSNLLHGPAVVAISR